MIDLNQQTLGQFTLSNGRNLAYAECGDPNGKSIFFFQGAPSTRFFHPDGALAAEMGARIIGIDRPGFGQSDFQSGRTVLDWSDDVVDLADHLGIDRFAVAGISAGGPYAAACACKIRHRLTHVALLSSMGPSDAPELVAGMPRERRFAIFLVNHIPWLVRPMIWLLRHPGRNPERFFAKYTAHNSSADRAIIDRPEIRAMLIKSYRESARQGARGFAWESIILTRQWGFCLQDIEMPVHIWHGDEDWSTPLAMAQALAEAIPNSRTHFFSGEGHFLLFTHWREILTLLVG